MKVVVLADTHFGVRNDRGWFLDNHKKFFDKVFFPYMYEHTDEIGAVVHLGDLFDRRKYVNHHTLRRTKTDFLYPLAKFAEQKLVRCFFLAGNHDCYYRDTNDINAVMEHLAGLCGYFYVLDNDACDVTVDGLDVALVPWVCPENAGRIKEHLALTKSQVLLGHLELAGFDMGSGTVCEHGFDGELLTKFDAVLSGHFHKRQVLANVTYVGAVGEYTWNDHGQPRGFAVLDTVTRSLTFIDNPYTIHEKVWYDGASTIVPDVIGKVVKLFVQSRADTDHLDAFMSALETQGLLSLEIIDADDVSPIAVTELSDADNTLRTFDEIIDQLDGVDRNELKLLIRELHTEAMGVTG